MLAVQRPNPKANNVIFLASHLVDARYFLGNYLGMDVQFPFKQLLGEGTRIEDVKTFPGIDELKTAWKEVSVLLSKALDGLDKDTLWRQSEIPFPIADPTVLGGIAFVMEHESYHIGQMGLLRKILGLPAMVYS